MKKIKITEAQYKLVNENIGEQEFFSIIDKMTKKANAYYTKLGTITLYEIINNESDLKSIYNDSYDMKTLAHKLYMRISDGVNDDLDAKVDAVYSKLGDKLDSITNLIDSLERMQLMVYDNGITGSFDDIITTSIGGELE